MSDRRASLRFLSGVMAVVPLLAGCAGDPAPPERIVLIVIDTLRRDFVSAYGSEPRTPNLDALAARGQRFDRALASFHQTSMSMSALFTGRTPSIEWRALNPSLPWNGTTWCGFARFGGDPLPADAPCLPEAIPTLGEELARAGYWTIGVASNEFLFEPSGFSRGFGDWSEVGGAGDRSELPGRQGGADAWKHRTWFDVHRAAETALDRRESDRLFLYVHYMDVHDYAADSSDLEARRAGYGRAVKNADVAVGKLLDALGERGLREDSVVIVTADHGERIGERHLFTGGTGHNGNPSFQEVLEVPLIVAPAVFDDVDRVVRSQDLFDRIRGLAGLPPTDATPLAQGELLVGELRFRTYLDGRFKSVIRRADASHRLFDLEADPDELRNVASDHPDVVAAHAERVDALARQLAAGSPAREALSEAERERLRVLGYLK